MSLMAPFCVRTPGGVQRSWRRVMLLTGLSVDGQRLGSGLHVEGRARSGVEGRTDPAWVGGCEAGQADALGQPVAQQPGGVLVRASLPVGVGVAQVDEHGEIELDLDVP